eukprot:760825-Hanusia_phi.AAC.3
MKEGDADDGVDPPAPTRTFDLKAKKTHSHRLARRERMNLRGGGLEDANRGEEQGAFKSQLLLKHLQRLRKDVQEAQAVHNEKFAMVSRMQHADQKQEQMRGCLEQIKEKIMKEWYEQANGQSIPSDIQDPAVQDKVLSGIFGNFYTPVRENAGEIV